METVPVLKVTEYTGTAKRDNVYTYMRCFAYNGSMFCNFTSFDECPLSGTMLTLILQHVSGENLMTVTCGKSTPLRAEITFDGTCADITKHINAQPVVTGCDEQGYYWGINFEITKEAFKKAFCKKLSDGDVFTGNFFIHSTQESAFGSAFPVPSGASAPCAVGGDSFFIVPY